MRLVIISGRSGSGKTIALQALEDAGFYCIDNLPMALLPMLASEIRRDQSPRLAKVAVGIDARNVPGQLERFQYLLREIEADVGSCEVIFLDAGDDNLLSRFSATRRKHPLSSAEMPLADALKHERILLDPIAARADLVIDTSWLTVHGLRDLIKERVVGKAQQGMGLLFESFGFKNGVPPDADMVFDARCLPNPYWLPHLRAHNGLEQPIIEFLDGQEQAQELIADIGDLLHRWLPRFELSDRHYMTVAVGCTGGYHRSVYVIERLAARMKECCAHVQVRHRELAAQGTPP